jgi:hypothetical protein
MHFDPDLVIISGTIVTTMIGFPLVRAIARRIERRAEPLGNSEILDRLQAIEQAIEAMAVEVERIGEGQRFTTQLLGSKASQLGIDPKIAARLERQTTPH